MAKKENSAIVVVTSDHHVGSTIGLMPPVVYIDEDEEVRPNRLQQEAYEFWSKDFWPSVWALAKKRSDKVITIFNGDCVEGDHHGSYQIWTKDQNIQQQVAVELFAPIVGKSYKSYFTRGTPVHVLPSGSSDEYIAREVGATPPKNSGHIRSSYRIRPTICGLIFDVAHHGPNPGTRIWNYGNSLRSYAKTIILDALARRLDPPAVLIRSHVHKKCWETIRDYGHKCEAFITPAWQWKTEYAQRVASQDDIADVGGLIITIDGGEISNAEFKIISYSQSDAVTAL